MKRATRGRLLAFIVPEFTLAQNQLLVGSGLSMSPNPNTSRVQGPRARDLRFEPVGDEFRVSLDGVNEQGPTIPRPRASSTALTCQSWLLRRGRPCSPTHLAASTITHGTLSSR